MTNDPNTKKYTSHVIETEDGDLAIELDAEMLSQLGWTEGTELFWDIDSNGSIILKEASSK